MSGNLGGLYRAIVRNTDDPDGRQRLQLEIPSLAPGALAWAEACVSSELPCRPAIGDTVWVMFEAGSLDTPVWIGIRPSLAG